MTNAPAPQEAIVESGVNTKVPTMPRPGPGLAQFDVADRTVPAMSPEKGHGREPDPGADALGVGAALAAFLRGTRQGRWIEHGGGLDRCPEGTVVLGADIGTVVAPS